MTWAGFRAEALLAACLARLRYGAHDKTALPLGQPVFGDPYLHSAAWRVRPQAQAGGRHKRRIAVRGQHDGDDAIKHACRLQGERLCAAFRHAQRGGIKAQSGQPDLA